MVKQSYQMLWAECLRLIRANVTEQQFKTWFEPIVFESYSEEEIALIASCPSPGREKTGTPRSGSPFLNRPAFS